MKRRRSRIPLFPLQGMARAPVRYKRKIAHTGRRVKVQTLRLSPDEKQALQRIREVNPLMCRGMAHGLPKLYRVVSKLREKGLVTKEGFRYYPTKYAFLLPKQLTLAQVREKIKRKKQRGIDWRNIFK